MTLRLVSTVLVVVAVAARSSPAQENPTEGAARDKWKQAYQKIARSIEMKRGEHVLEMYGQPLLLYTNPVVETDQHGAIFLWTEQGRPAILGSIWSARHRVDPKLRNVAHEWHALSESSDLTATREHQILWKSAEPGIAWLSLPDLPVPADSPTSRLVQMRTLARRLAAQREGDRHTELRLMTQPLFRYQQGTEGALDGAIFAYALATDPELLLWVEAAGDEGKESWRVAFARFGIQPMTVKDGERTVWSCGLEKGMVRQGKYSVIWGAEVMPAHP